MGHAQRKWRLRNGTRRDISTAVHTVVVEASLCIFHSPRCREKYASKFVGELLNPFSTGVPFLGQTSQIPSSLSPKRDCGSKRVNPDRAKTQCRFGDEPLEFHVVYLRSGTAVLLIRGLTGTEGRQAALVTYHRPRQSERVASCGDGGLVLVTDGFG